MTLPRPSSGDPRKLGGDIAGPGGPHDFGENVIDTRRAVLLDSADVVQIDNPSDARKFVGVMLGGRVNRSQDRTRVLYLMDADGAAAIVSQLVGLAQRSDAPWADEFGTRLAARLAELPSSPEETE